MTGAGALAYLLFYLIRGKQIEEKDEVIRNQRKAFEKLDAEKRNLAAFSKVLESERKNVNQGSLELKKENQFLLQKLKKLEDDKKFIINEFNVFKKNIASTSGEQLAYEMPSETIKEKLRAAEINVENWKDKYFILKQAYEDNLKLINQLKERNRSYEQLFGSAGESKAPDIDWQVKYDALKNEFEQIIKEKAESNRKLKTEFQEMRLHYENELMKYQNSSDSPKVVQDDLQQISGIGPYVEQSLNAMGIFRYQQLAALSGDDISKISEKINISPSRIIKEEWVEQAKELQQ